MEKGEHEEYIGDFLFLIACVVSDLRAEEEELV